MEVGNLGSYADLCLEFWDQSPSDLENLTGCTNVDLHLCDTI